MNLIEYPDREMMMIDVANRIAGELKSCLFQHDHASFAVPGGTTPGPMFDALSATSVDWSRVHVTLTDERWVPEDHGRSNTRLVRKRLLTDKAADAVFVPVHRDGAEPEEVIDDLIEGLRPELPLSILLLGMGGDMHTASLMPGAPRLAAALASDAPPLMVMQRDSDEPRITMTAPVLRSAMSTHLLIHGPEKRAALERAQSLPPEDAPVALVLKNATVHWAA